MPQPNQPSTIKNSIYSLGAFAWPIILSFFAAPFIVHRLGTENYGLFALVSSIVGFLAFLDFGVAPALVRYTAEFSATKNFRQLNVIFSAAVVFYLVLGTIGAAGISLFALVWAPTVIKVSPGNVPTVHLVFLLAAAGFFINMVLTAFAAIPGSLQRFDITSRVNVVVATISTFLTIAVVAAGGGVAKVVALGILTSLAAIFVYRRINRGLLPELAFRFRGIGVPVFKKILAFGGYATVATLATTILFELDKLILSSLLGASAVTYYVLPGNLALKVQGAVVALTTVIFPLSTSLYARGAHTELKQLYGRATRLVVLFLAILVTPMYVYAYPFLLFWLGTDFAHQSATILQVLLATYSLLALTAIPVFLVFGIGKPVYGAIFASTAAILDVILLFLLIPHYKITGAAWAYLLAVAPTSLLFVAYVEKRIIGFEGSSLYKKLVPQALLLLALGMGCSLLLRPLIGSLFEFILAYVGTVSLVFAAFWFLGFATSEDKQFLSSYLGRMKAR